MDKNDMKQFYGLVGYPLGHSFSRDYFNKNFAENDINAEYLNFELEDIGSFMEVIAEFGPTLRGLNVTIPYKRQVMQYLDDLDEAAKEIGAVNVVRFVYGENENDFRLVGYNSDVIGFCNSISPLLNETHKKALILGTGGASLAVEYGLKQLGIEPLYVSRTRSDKAIAYEDITPEVMAERTVIVNATPLGMFPKVDACPTIPYELLTDKHVCYDLVYNPAETLFMKRAAEYGATVKNGLEMLILQAEAAWQIWNK